MKFSNAAVAAIMAGVASAQAADQCAASASAIATCATTAIDNAGSSIGNCASTDYACQCSYSDSILSAVTDSAFNDCINVNDFDGAGDYPLEFASLCSCISAEETATSVIATTTTLAITTPTLSIPTSVSPTLPTGTPSVPSLSLPTGSLSVPSGVSIPTGIPTGLPTGVSTGLTSVPPGSILTGITNTISPSLVHPGTTGSLSIPVFTGAAGTASAFLPVGGVFGAVIGALALL